MSSSLAPREQSPPQSPVQSRVRLFVPWPHWVEHSPQLLHAVQLAGTLLTQLRRSVLLPLQEPHVPTQERLRVDVLSPQAQDGHVDHVDHFLGLPLEQPWD